VERVVSEQTEDAGECDCAWPQNRQIDKQGEEGPVVPFPYGLGQCPAKQSLPWLRYILASVPQGWLSLRWARLKDNPLSWRPM
jgi:hypothetical protein